jgi:hypothetical protein
MTALKIVAFDQHDLTVISAHLQDAVVRVGDMAYVPKERRFAVILNRFDWAQESESAQAGGNKPEGGKDAGGKAPATAFRRYRSALRFEHVKSVQVQGFSQKKRKQVLSLLAIDFTALNEGEPDGHITLYFAAGAAVRLEVEVIEGELRDLGPSWKTPAKPEHPEFET